LVEHKEKGGKVFGTFCVCVPEEVIIAAGGIAVGPFASSAAGADLRPLVSTGYGLHLPSEYVVS